MLKPETMKVRGNSVKQAPRQLSGEGGYCLSLAASIWIT